MDFFPKLFGGFPKIIAVSMFDLIKVQDFI